MCEDALTQRSPSEGTTGFLQEKEIAGLVGLDEHRSMRCDGDVETQRDVRLKTERGAMGQFERFPPPW